MHRLVVACSLAFLAWGMPVARAELIVEATAVVLGGSYRYHFSVTNLGAADVILVSILDAPLVDPLIQPSLTAPSGFLASYDSGLGIVDFLEDVNLFSVGTTTQGFHFESLADPLSGVLDSFVALDIEFNSITGVVAKTLVLLGDMDRDGDTDFDDIDDFVLGLTDPGLYQAVHGISAAVTGDTDLDGDQDFDDIDDFVGILSSASHRSNALMAPEPDSLWLMFLAVGLAGRYRRIQPRRVPSQ